MNSHLNILNINILDEQIGGFYFSKVELKDKLSGSVETYLYLNKGDAMNMTADMIRTDILGMPNVPQMNAPFTTSRKGGIEFNVNWQDRIGKVGYRLGVNYSFWDERVTRHATVSSNY